MAKVWEKGGWSLHRGLELEEERLLVGGTDFDACQCNQKHSPYSTKSSKQMIQTKTLSHSKSYENPLRVVWRLSLLNGKLIRWKLACCWCFIRCTTRCIRAHECTHDDGTSLSESNPIWWRHIPFVSSHSPQPSISQHPQTSIQNSTNQRRL